MAQHIDPSSVNLNTLSYPAHFFADYYPVNPAQLPADCNLPAASTLNVGNTPLTPLNIACEFTFPDVVAIPPIYNPPLTIPPACESLNVSSSIKATGAAKKSYLNFTSRGPLNCGISVDGLFDVTACESVNVANNITYSGRAKPTGSLALQKAPGNNCDLVLGGNINVDACNPINVQGTFNVKSRHNAATGGATLTRIGDCGIELIGGIDISACAYPEAGGNITITSKHGGGSGHINLSRKGECGVALDGNIDISACAYPEAGGNITITSKHGGGSGNITLSRLGECGVVLDGNIDISACDRPTASGNVIVTSKHGGGSGNITLSSDGECGLKLDGNIDISACNQIAASGVVNSSGSGTHRSSASLALQSSADGCGVQLVGGIHIDAINCVYASGSMSVYAPHDGAKVVTPMQLIQKSCNQLALQGGIMVTACDETTLEQEQAASTPIVFNSRTGINAGSMELVPTLTFGGTKCEKTASITVNASDVNLSICDYVYIEPDIAAESTATFQFNFGVLGTFTTDIQIYLRVEKNPLDCTATITPLFIQPDPIDVPIGEVELTVCNNGVMETIKVLKRG